MTPQQQNIWIAENVMGAQRYHYISGISTYEAVICESYKRKPHYRILVKNNNLKIGNSLVKTVLSAYYGPKYTSDLPAVFEVEEKIKELGRQDVYVNRLFDVYGYACDASLEFSDFFNILHATPEQRMKAAYLTMKEGNT